MRASFDPDENALRLLLEERRALVERALERLVPAEQVAPFVLHGAMRWSLFAGGKRFRPLLLLLTGETLGAAPRRLLPSACAFEMLHTYSLIHDDLPAMDDDDLRRGQPTCHVRYGEAVAILAGDALQALAFQTVVEDEELTPEVRLRVLSELGRAAGTPDGMVAGQVEDLEAESRVVAGAELEHIHRRKTGALITAAARAGAIIAGAGEAEIAAVARYASSLGLLFQITDDLLDVTSTAAALGKTPGKDERARKATYPSLYGLEAARERARAAFEEAGRALAGLERPAGELHALARFVLDRRA